jgi:hypothetical protein
VFHYYMKMRKAFFVLAATLAVCSSALGDKVPLEQVPLAAQEAIRSRAGRNMIAGIERVQRGDQVTYEARWKSGPSEQRLLVSEAGTILRDALAPTAGAAATTLTLANKSPIAITETPPPVQKAIRDQVRGAGVESVEKGIWNGQPVYQASYTRDGQQVLFQVNENGQPLVSKATVPTFQPKYAGLATVNVPLGATAKMAYLYAPEAVREAIAHFAGDAPIEDFQRGNWNGKTIYEAAFTKNGEPMKLQLLDDGSLLTPPPAGAAQPASSPETAVGAPAAGAVVTGQQQP